MAVQKPLFFNLPLRAIDGKIGQWSQWALGRADQLDTTAVKRFAPRN